MPFTIVQNDITKIHTDIIVNAANSQLLPGGGVCGAIFEAAGYDKLRKACSKIKHCDTANAVITNGFNLCKHIVHTVGPAYKDGRQNEDKLLYSCYKASLDLAKSVKAESIAFPLISAGIYSYPKREALNIATKAITDFLSDNDMDVVLVIYDKHFFEIDRKRFTLLNGFTAYYTHTAEISRKKLKDEYSRLGIDYWLYHYINALNGSYSPKRIDVLEYAIRHFSCGQRFSALPFDFDCKNIGKEHS